MTKQHLVLVHGAGHGAWCWYKVATLLQSAGYHVTALDLAASGADAAHMADVPTFDDYSRPLLDLVRGVPAGEKVILVGHSFGGLSLALAMEMFPEKVAAAVFVAAVLPDTLSPPSHVLEKCWSAITDWMDSQMQPTTVLLGPQFMQSRLYQLCSPEDVTLSTSLVRPVKVFMEEMQQRQPFSKNRYGTVDKFYIICSKDLTLAEEDLHWMIARSLVKSVKTIITDHMAMLSAPKELFECLHEIASTYA